MGIHAVSYYEERDARELVDVDYQCSRTCMVDTLDKYGDPTMTASVIAQDGAYTGTHNNADGGSMSWGAYPCGEETDYDVYCSGCEQLLWKGLQSDD